MSIRIDCPHCGTRAIEEWVYGEVFDPPDHLTEPADIAFDRAFMHNNRQGPVREAWFHLYGCRRWVYLDRDTETDHIL